MHWDASSILFMGSSEVLCFSVSDTLTQMNQLGLFSCMSTETIHQFVLFIQNQLVVFVSDFLMGYNAPPITLAAPVIPILV